MHYWNKKQCFTEKITWKYPTIYCKVKYGLTLCEGAVSRNDEGGYNSRTKYDV